MSVREVASNYGKNQYWDQIYSGPVESLSWNERNNSSTLDLMLSCTKNPTDTIADVGCGHGGLVLALSKLGFKSIFALDVSKTALNILSSNLMRLDLKQSVTMVNSDVLEADEVIPDQSIKVWHDRFTFHFLIYRDQITKYIHIAQNKIAAGGYVVLTTYSDSGPDTCSGLPVKRYNINSLFSLFGSDFELLDFRYGDHVTPKGSVKPYVSVVLKKRYD